MRIGIVCPYSFDVPGGVQGDVRDLAQTLIGLGHQVSVLAPAHDEEALPAYVVSAGRAVPVPYNHSNIDSDEVIYYVSGEFGSRRGVEVAALTLHPRGIPHGPHPGTIVASRPATRTDELAVMVDTVRPLQLTRQAMEMDDPNYPYSWLE